MRCVIHFTFEARSIRTCSSAFTTGMDRFNVASNEYLCRKGFSSLIFGFLLLLLLLLLFSYFILMSSTFRECFFMTANCGGGRCNLLRQHWQERAPVPSDVCHTQKSALMIGLIDVVFVSQCLTSSSLQLALHAALHTSYWTIETCNIVDCELWVVRFNLLYRHNPTVIEIP